jgi:Trk-type K+ transport system membrane component
MAPRAAALIVVLRDWRLVLFAYAAFSAMLALLLSQVIPTEWALLQAIVGGLIAVMFFLSARQLRWHPASGVSREDRWPQMASLTSFRALAVALTTVAFLASRDSVTLPQVDLLFRDMIFWLGLIGLLGLALHEEPLHAGLALLIVLAGSQLLLFSLTQQRLLIGLLEGGQLLLGLAISYLMVARGLSAARPAAAAASPARDAYDLRP